MVILHVFVVPVFIVIAAIMLQVARSLNFLSTGLANEVNLWVLQDFSRLILCQYLSVVTKTVKRLHWELWWFSRLQDLRLKTENSTNLVSVYRC